MNSQALVQALAKDEPPWRIDKQIAEIKSNVQYRVFKILHIFRQANSVPDALPKIANSTCKSATFQSARLPTEIISLVSKQCMPYITLE